MRGYKKIVVILALVISMEIASAEELTKGNFFEEITTDSTILNKDEIKLKTENSKEEVMSEKEIKGLKGTAVPNVPGLNFTEDIYPINLFERYTLDLNHDYYDIEDTAIRNNAKRFFSTTKNYTYEFVQPNGASFYYPSYTGRNNYAGELKEGFNQVSIRVRGTGVNEVVQVPVFLESQNFRIINEQYAVKIIKKTSRGISFPYFSGKDIRRESQSAINQKLEDELTFEVYNIHTHNRIPDSEIDILFLGSSVENEYARGQRDIKFSIDNEEFTMKDSLLIVSDEFIQDFGNLEEWTTVNYNDPIGSVVNPINFSKVAMPNRGIRGKMDQINGYLLRDQYDFGMAYERGWGQQVRKPEIRSRTQIATNVGIREVGESGKGSLYKAEGSSIANWGSGNAFSNWPQITGLPENPGKVRAVVDMTVTGKYFLKKNNQLLQIQVDPTNNVTYALSNGLSRNLNFSTRNYMYNNSTMIREFGINEIVDTDYYADSVPIYTLGQHKGFKLVSPQVSENRYQRMELSVKIKDNNNNWLTDVERYRVDSVGPTTSNPFGNDLQQPGQETNSSFLPSGVKLTSASDTAFALGTPWKKIGFDERLVSGYDMFLGNEIEYLTLALNKNEAHIYQDQFDESIATQFTVGRLQGTKEGNLEVKYPDGFVDKHFAKTLNSSTISDTYQFKRSHFPKELNPISGTKVTYPLETIFVNQSNTALNDLPSNEAFYNLHVYNLGATGDLQRLKKGTLFNKKANEVISKPIFLPGHESYIEYVYLLDGEEITKVNPTLEELGIDENNDKMQYLTIRMTDKHPRENNRSSIIKVPVLVSEEIINKGVLAYGEDFKIEPTDMTKWSDKEIDEFFIKHSKATGFNLDINPVERIPVEIDRTDIPFNLKAKEKYTLKIIANSPTDPNVNDMKEIIVTVASKIEAQASPQNIPVGKKILELDLKDFVTEVKSSGEILDKDKYEVSLLGEIPDVVTGKDKPVNVPVEVRLLGELEGTGETLDVPVSVYWGNSIAFGGDEKDGRMGGGAYTIHNGKDDSQPYIAAVSGAIESKDENKITSDPTFAGKYIEFEQYDLSSAKDIYIVEEGKLKPSYQLTALGSDKKNLVLDKWGTNRVKEINHGDIVRGWSAEAGKQYLTNKNLPEALNDKENEVYYEVTDSGFRRLNFNRYEAGQSDNLIMYGTSNKELDKRAKDGDFIKLIEPSDSVRILGFKEGNYPNTSKPNEPEEFNSGTIVIEEDLNSGKKIHYEVTLLFTIVDGGLSIKYADNLSFGIQEVPSSDIYYAPRDKKNEVIVEDTRHTPKAWDLKATMENPLHYLNGGLPQELQGSSILMLDPKGDKVLSKDGVVVHKTTDIEAVKGENKIKWNNQLNEGYRLFIKNGTAENNKRYESTITYSIDDKPKAKAVGSK